jgi:hypothetical protein
VNCKWKDWERNRISRDGGAGPKARYRTEKCRESGRAEGKQHRDVGKGKDRQLIFSQI